MSILGISERYSGYLSNETVNSESNGYACTHYTTSSDKNANYKRYYISSSDRYCYIENAIIYEEINCVYSSYDETISERNAQALSYISEIVDRFAYLPSYNTFSIQFNPSVPQTYCNDRTAISIYCSALSDRYATTNVIQFTERFVVASYVSFITIYDTRLCTASIESANHSDRFVVYNRFHTKYEITINKKEQEITYVTSNNNKYLLIDNIKTAPIEYTNTFDIIQLPNDLTSSDVFLIHKVDTIINNETISIWKCANLNDNSMLLLPSIHDGNYLIFDGYFIFNTSLVTFNMSYSIIQEMYQFPKKSSKYNKADNDLFVKSKYPALLENFDSVEDYIKDAWDRRKIAWSIDNKTHLFDKNYVGSYKPCVPIPFRIKLNIDLYNNYMRNFIFRYNIITNKANKRVFSNKKIILKIST